MVYKANEKNREHAYKTIENDVKKDQLKGVILLSGQESYLVDWAIGLITEHYVNPACRDFDLIRFNGLTASFEEIRNCCETLPMLSMKKIIIVDKLKCLEAESEDEKKWSEYFREIPNACQLILVSETLDGRRKITKMLNEIGKIYQFGELPETFLKKFIEKQLKAGKKSAKAQVITDLIAESGYYDKNTSYTLYNLDNDLKKLIAHASGDEIFKEDVNLTLSGNIERDIFAMMDALGKGNKGAAFHMLTHLFLYGENEYKILGLICSQFETVTLIKEMKEDGKNLPEIAAYLGLNEYRVKLMLSLCENYSLQKLRAVLQAAYQVDQRIKAGILDKTLALEIFIAEI